MDEAQKDPEFTRKLNGIKAVFDSILKTSTQRRTVRQKDEGVIIAKRINSMQIEGLRG